MEDEDVLESMSRIRSILDANPYARDLMEVVKAGRCSLEQATRQISEILPAEESNLILKTQQIIQERMFVYTSEGHQRLNPLFTSALAERAFLDGDVPELRTGLLPKGARPAVPVETDAINPVVVGMMLETASDMAQEQLQRQLEQWRETVNLLLEEAPEGTSLETLGDKVPAVPTGIPGYSAGDFPVPMRDVPEPTLLEIQSLTPEARRGYAHQAIATSQGRRTLVPAIQRMLARKLGVKEGRVLRAVMTANWTVQTWGAQDISADFSPVDLAVAVLARDIINKAGPAHFDTVEVVPVADIPLRKFGWIARVGVST